MKEEWEAVYDTYVPDVYKFLLYFTGNHEDAEDLTQDTFIKAFGNWEQFEHRASAKTWILSIARNLAIDRLRKRKRSNILLALLRGEPVVSPDLPEELVHASETKRELYAAIQSLKPNYRAVAVLRGIQECTPVETALILGWTPNKVNVMFHRATKMLRIKLSQGKGGNICYEENYK